jgi:hypothetical protein
VHRAAKERVRMADERDGFGLRIGDGPEKSFERACRPLQKKTAVKDVSHVCEPEVRPPSWSEHSNRRKR